MWRCLILFAGLQELWDPHWVGVSVALPTGCVWCWRLQWVLPGRQGGYYPLWWQGVVPCQNPCQAIATDGRRANVKHTKHTGRQQWNGGGGKLTRQRPRADKRVYTDDTNLVTDNATGESIANGIVEQPSRCNTVPTLVEIISLLYNSPYIKPNPPVVYMLLRPGVGDCTSQHSPVLYCSIFTDSW